MHPLRLQLAGLLRIASLPDGLAKQGARFGHTKVRGYHPLLATLAGTDEVVGARLRGGNAHTARGAAGFLTQVFNRLRRAGAAGPMVLRADSGFYNRKVTEACASAGVSYSITVKLSQGLHKRIAAIDESDWTPIPYWIGDGADVAEITYRPFSQRHPEVRLIVRRVKPTPGSQLALLATYDYHAFITNRQGGTVELEADHRRHAVIEDVIRDLKYGVGLNHLPSGRFAANAAWMLLNIIAHNLGRWTGRIGLGAEGPPMTTKTLRTRLLDLPGRLTISGGKRTLHLPQGWPWEQQFNTVLDNLRAVVSLRISRATRSRPASIPSRRSGGGAAPPRQPAGTGRPRPTRQAGCVDARCRRG